MITMTQRRKRPRISRPLAGRALLALAALGVLAVGGTFAPPASAAEPGAPEDHPIGVVISLGNQQPVTQSREQLEALAVAQVDRLRTFWLQQSQGKVDIRLESVTFLDINDDGATDIVPCGASGNRVGPAITDSGWVGGPRRHLLLLSAAGCNGGSGTASFANNGNANSGGWVIVDQPFGGPRDGITAHEFGHNLGNGHANVWVCADGAVDGPLVSAGGTCTSPDYSDDADVMGVSHPNAVRNFSAPNAIRLGFRALGTDYLAYSGETDTDVTLQARDLLSGLRALQITDPISGDVYYVEQSSDDTYNDGFDLSGTRTIAGLPYEEGYGVRVLRLRAGNIPTVLATPADAEGKRSLYWAPGTEFVSPSGGIRVDIVSSTATTATLSVVTTADVVAPAPPTGLASNGRTVTGAAEPNTAISVTNSAGEALGTAMTAPDGTFTVALTPAQADGALLSVVSADSVGNTSPVAAVTVLVPAAGGPYELVEGGSLSLTATGNGTTSWDVNGDGTFGDATGSTVTLTWQQLVDLGIDDGPYSGSVTARFGGDSSSDASATLTVGNAAPVATLDGPETARVGGSLTLELGAVDPSPADAAGRFDYVVDWGDGSEATRVPGPADPPVDHTYSAPGTYLVSATATDRDDGTSAAVTHTITVGAAPATSTVTPPSSGDVAVGGSSGNAAGLLADTGADVAPFAATAVAAAVLFGLGLGAFLHGRRKRTVS